MEWNEFDGNDERATLSKSPLKVWEAGAKLLTRAWCSQAEVKQAKLDVEGALEVAIKTERKLGRIDWEGYLEEATTSKLGLGHKLTKLKEIDDMPKAMGQDGYHSGATHVLESERTKWAKLVHGQGSNQLY